jgi:hypothetical protein
MAGYDGPLMRTTSRAYQNVEPATTWTEALAPSPGWESALRFTLQDGMILIAGTAVGGAMAREFILMGGQWYGRFAGREPVWILATSHLLYGWSLGLLGCQACRRGRLGRRVARWPGTAACLAVFMASMFNLLYFWLIGLARTDYARSFLAVSVTRPLSIAAGIAVAWSVLLVSGRWRSSRAWPDLLGRILGWAWLALFAASLAYVTR